MTDPLPQWPPDWVEDHDIAAEQVVVASDDLTLATALRADDRVLISVSWPGGRRYILIDPVGNDDPRALRAGEEPDDAELRRQLDAMWSQALGIAKKLIDGDIEVGPDGLGGGEEEQRKGRRWRRGS
jgi:hypothetical protein